MAIFFHTVDLNFTLPHKRVYKKWISDTIQSAGYKVGDISYIFCSEREILKVNKQYLNHNYYTDIITFPYVENRVISADIYISIPTVRYNAEKYRQTFTQELSRVIIHGILHMIGYNDFTSEEKHKMLEAENRCLNELNSFL
ncbi:MAG TPA: rRNA maturation RNase YbeY [Perlabentimonas sp.]|nr:rRNA maturation RNase YbeY [Bacteroidales bacterium]MDD4671976.1 rRNA maturation RNase YbeY [Bacteroidales bacterium]MDY0347202.1 rRNA maturation RNase YbeY [Tenuifilaceae bacterium]HZJ73725.1 rRNA maturation RNase YbeY [Perlabentimonas sp.]